MFSSFRLLMSLVQAAAGESLTMLVSRPFRQRSSTDKRIKQPRVKPPWWMHTDKRGRYATLACCQPKQVELSIGSSAELGSQRDEISSSRSRTAVMGPMSPLNADVSSEVGGHSGQEAFQLCGWEDGSDDTKWSTWSVGQHASWVQIQIPDVLLPSMGWTENHRDRTTSSILLTAVEEKKEIVNRRKYKTPCDWDNIDL